MAEQNLVDVSQQQVFADDFDGNFDSGDAGSGDFEAGAEGGAPGPGQGQSKSSRRRRRKRKNKVGTAGESTGAAEGTAAQATIVMEGESLALAASSPAQASSSPAPSRAPQGQGGGQGQQGQGGQAQGKRWKKKFRDRERRGGRSDGPGNDVRADSGGSGGGHSNGYSRDRGGRPDNFGNLVDGFKRKGKSGPKERGFVGPMDHSYRAENPEFGAAPPSTISLNGSHGRRNGHRHHGDSQPIDHSMPRAIPIPENAQTHIYFFIEELFLIAKIQETARKQGIKVAFVKNEKDALAELTSGEDANRPALIVFDLNNANAKPLTTIPKLKTKLKRGTSIVGFLSHLQGDLKAKAMEAGCDVVMPRAAFSQNLPNLLRRYGVEEEDEVNYNY